MKRHWIGILAIAFVFILPQLMTARPEYAAFEGNNCMVCHTGPIGGFGRKLQSPSDPGWITDNVQVTGDLMIMGLSDMREGSRDRTVIFPMQGALHVSWEVMPTLKIIASQDFGILREIYGMIQNTSEIFYLRAGYFTLPYGILFPDHTAFIKEGRIESGERTFEEAGIGAGLFGVRYKDGGVEVGLDKKPWFINLAFTSGVVGQRERAFPSSQGGDKVAFTRRAGFITKYLALGGSLYTNDNVVLDRRILRYGGFGWLRAGPFALIVEHDEGEEEQFTVAGSTQISASYAELVYGFNMPNNRWPSSAKARYERLDPNRSLDNDLLERWVFSVRTQPKEYFAIEGFYRSEKEEPVERNNDDIIILGHFFF